MAIVDLQQIAASLYETVTQLNTTATQMVGIEAMYCRLLPYDNGEDVIVQEYTLHQYDCPKNIKVIIGNPAYQVGNFTIDLFGIKSTESLAISIDKVSWEETYGTESIPQKGDFIYIQVLHKPYEISTSSPVHTVGNQITSWNLQLTEWRHKASRKETEDFTISIDELTNSQDRLFGEEISKEVADAVIEVETSYNTTTYVDPIKDYDIDSIVLIDNFVGENGNLISNAYYDFINATKNVTYKSISAIYDPAVKENHWIYSCWFKTNNNEIISSSIKIEKDLYIKDSNYWWFQIVPNINIVEGEEITIYRGSIVKLSGIVESKECESGWTLKVSASECLIANKKVPNFWKSGVWKMQKYAAYNLLSGYNNEDNKTLSIDMDSTTIKFKFGDISKNVEIETNSKIFFNEWTYIAFDICKTSIRTIIYQIINQSDKTIKGNILCDFETYINIKTFQFDYAAIECMQKDIKMANIRLYENEYPLEDNYKLDMYSEVTRNASKLILVDDPNPANKMSFKTKVR